MRLYEYSCFSQVTNVLELGSNYRSVSHFEKKFRCVERARKAGYVGGKNKAEKLSKKDGQR